MIKNYVISLVAFFLLSSATTSALAGSLVSGLPQSFIFSAPGAYAEKPITVYYYKPRDAAPDAKILFAIHGVERSGKRARDNWIAAAEKYGVIVVSPEFDEVRFPARLFQMGGMEQKNPADWTFQIIESLFDKIRTDEGLTTPGYYLFGHSAGGQFVHRYVLMMDKPRIKMAVAANSGTYTFPSFPTSMFSERFPWLLDDNRIDRLALKERLGQNLIVLLGEEDVKTSGDFPRSRQAMAQGATRLERGKNFCAAALSQANELKTDLRWRCVTVPGVGHNSAKMSQAAAKILFDGGSRF
jgi:pimeloyl-ACP methyl ester carboxylesterase